MTPNLDVLASATIWIERYLRPSSCCARPLTYQPAEHGVMLMFVELLMSSIIMKAFPTHVLLGPLQRLHEQVQTSRVITYSYQHVIASNVRSMY